MTLYLSESLIQHPSYENYQSIVHLLEHGAVSKAIECLSDILEESPQAHQFWGLLSVCQFQRENLPAAKKAVEKALEIKPHPHYFLSAGNIAYRLSEPAAALEYYQHLNFESQAPEVQMRIVALCLELEKWALALDSFLRLPLQHLETEVVLPLVQGLFHALPTGSALRLYEQSRQQGQLPAETWNLIGVLHQKAGQFELATKAFGFALEDIPHQPEFANNLGSAYMQSGHYQEAAGVLVPLIHKHPDHGPGLYHLGQSYVYLRQFNKAQRAFSHLIELNPAHVDWLVDFVSILEQDHHLKLAIEMCEMLKDWVKNKEKLHHYLGKLYYQYLDVDKALAHFRRAALLADHPEQYSWLIALLSPLVFESSQALTGWRKHFKDTLHYRVQKMRQAHRKSQLVGMNYEVLPPFYLAYQGFDDRRARESVGKLFTEMFHQPYRFKKKTSLPQKKRVGLVSDCFLPGHVVVELYRRTFEVLNESPDIDVMCFQLNRLPSSHPFGGELPVFYRQSPHELLEDILEQEIDILIYMDLGTCSGTYFMALQRVAPIQCVLSGFPVTSGLPEMDYFISNALAEPPGADAHYSETLVSTPYSYCQVERPELSSEHHFEMPQAFENNHLYLCPMALFKIHPDMDAPFLAILEQDPKAILCFVDMHSPVLKDKLWLRFKRTLAPHASRVHFFKRQKPALFLSLMSQCHVVLDSFHFGGGSTSRLCLGLGIPIVTWPGHFARGRFTYALYRQIGVMDCVAETQGDFAQRALELALNPEFKSRVQANIKAGSPAIFEDAPGLEAFTALIRDLKVRS